MKSDTDLQMLVLQALAADPHVEEASIGVSVHDGVVTLSGIVRSIAAQDAAEAATRRVRGVQAVANEIELKVGTANPTDPEIADAVRKALAASPRVKHERIQVTVSGNGRVTLHGTVASASERDAAVAIVHAVRGVELLHDALVVTPVTATVTEVRSSIAHALERHLSRDLDRIDVEVRGDTVVLTGTIGSRAEQRAAVGAVRGLPGIARVDDRLHVESP